MENWTNISCQHYGNRYMG